MRLTDHFTTDEFRCPCCGAVHEPNVLKLCQALERARAHTGPMRIWSGFRCKEHNTAVGGGSNSAHLQGLAADIACSTSVARFRLLKALLDAEFLRLGIGANYVHADIAEHLPQPCIWTYYGCPIPAAKTPTPQTPHGHTDIAGGSAARARTYQASQS